MISYRLFAVLFIIALPSALAAVILSALHQPFFSGLAFIAATSLGVTLFIINFINIAHALRQEQRRGFRP